MTPLFLRDVGIHRPELWESFKRLWFRVSSSLFLGCRLIDIWMCLFLILGENGELCNVLSKMSGIPEENLEYTKVWLFNALLAHFLTFFYFPPQTDYKLISSLQCFSHEHSHINLVLTTRHLQWSINAEWRNLGVLHVISCPSNLFLPPSLTFNVLPSRDKTEPLKELTNEEREQMLNKNVSELNTSSRISMTYSPKKERALKIHLDWSPKKRDD